MFFKKRSHKDGNYALASNNGSAVFEQLPFDVQKRIYCEYLFEDFQKVFSKMFQISRRKQEPVDKQRGIDTKIMDILTSSMQIEKRNTLQIKQITKYYDWDDYVY